MSYAWSPVSDPAFVRKIQASLRNGGLRAPPPAQVRRVPIPAGEIMNPDEPPPTKREL